MHKKMMRTHGEHTEKAEFSTQSPLEVEEYLE